VPCGSMPSSDVPVPPVPPQPVPDERCITSGNSYRLFENSHALRINGVVCLESVELEMEGAYEAPRLRIKVGRLAGGPVRRGGGDEERHTRAVGSQLAEKKIDPLYTATAGAPRVTVRRRSDKLQTNFDKRRRWLMRCLRHSCHARPRCRCAPYRLQP
jgi:hypothetical protein